MSEPKPSKAWTFRSAASCPIHRLGFGAMRLTGPGIWGEPADPAEAIRTLKRTRDLGIDFIDTADSYGPDVSERLIREALHPYGDLRIATKAGLARTGPDRWVPLGRPEYLIQQAHKSLRQLGVERIDLWQLHRIDPKVPRDEQFDAVKSLLDAGVIRHAGLSEVTVEEIEAASKYFPVATVQNRYNLVDRKSEEVLTYCERQGIGFIPWFPLGAGELAQPGSAHRQDRQAPRRHRQPDRARLDAPQEPGDAADPGDLAGRSPRGERRRRAHRAGGRRDGGARRSAEEALSGDPVRIVSASVSFLKSRRREARASGIFVWPGPCSQPGHAPQSIASAHRTGRSRRQVPAEAARSEASEPASSCKTSIRRLTQRPSPASPVPPTSASSL